MPLLKFLWLLATCGNLYGVKAASVLTTLSDSNTNNNTTFAAAINLPKGFDAQMAPVNPLLYPFATAEIPPSFPAWQPMLNNNSSNTQQGLNYPPMLQDRISAAPTAPPLSLPSLGEAEQNIGPILESIVYGTWKPEQVPVQPEQMFDLARSESESMEDVAKEGIDDRLKAILSGQHDLPEQYHFPESRHSAVTSSTERKNEDDYAKKTITKKYGRQKIPTRENKNNNQIKTGIEVINVNSSDPKLLIMVKQINHSAEIITVPEKAKPKTNMQSTWIPIAPTTPETEKVIIESTAATTQATTSAPKNWPTDFEHTTQSASLTNDNLWHDSTGPPQALSGFSIPESLLPQMPFNITKMGVPYEHQNSSEEPSICVPLTVREESLANTPGGGTAPEIVNVERVYCFPLPLAEIRSEPDSNVSSTALGIEAKVSNVYSDFEEAQLLPSAASNILNTSGILLFIIVSLAFVRYHHHPN